MQHAVKRAHTLLLTPYTRFSFFVIQILPCVPRTESIISMSESDATELLNLSELEERLGGDNELLEQILELFAETYPESLDEIDAAVAARNADDLRRSAHTLKGMVANLGAQSPMQRAYELETMGKEGTFDDAEAKAAHLRTLVSQFHQALLEVRFPD